MAIICHKKEYQIMQKSVSKLTVCNIIYAKKDFYNEVKVL